jgi:hypothetical protein
MRARRWIVALGLAVGASACAPSPPPSRDVFTPAHPTAMAAIQSFLNVRSRPVQPIPFPHLTHIEKAMLTCTDYCHESATKGPRAGIPSVRTCMICHESIATDRPLIQQVTDYYNRGVDIPWQRVYGFSAEMHVRFDHAPHLRASVECASCHGPVEAQTVAERSVNHTMGFCVNCHRERQASNDCLTCHF